MNDIIAKAIVDAKFSNRSIAKPIFAMIKERNLQYDIAELTVEVVAYCINEGKTLTNTLTMIGSRIYQLLEIEEQNQDRVIKLGASIIDILTKLELTDIQKYSVIENNGQEQWFLTVINNDFFNILNSYNLTKLTANLGYKEWTTPVMKIGDRKIDIVKKARRYNLLSNYRKSKMIDVYDALNALGMTEWKINKNILEVLNMPSTVSRLIPEAISEQERRLALSNINKNERTAHYINEIRFKELEDKGYNSEKAKHYAHKASEDYKIKNNKDHLKIISKWSKERNYRTCIEIAKNYGDDTLNFLYCCDSRGRVYAFNQVFLNPQGADFAKALLQFANPKPISVYDFYITIANHAGQDKLSYDDRIKWVETNKDNIIEVGSNTWSEKSLKFLDKSGIDKEAKSKFQFIAAAQEYVKLIDWIAEGNNQDEFLCSIPVAYDATNSGLQILSGIGRDEYVAPYVNITNTDKPGDIYQLIGTAVANKKEIDKLLPIKSDDKAWRKIVKRNVMTKNYAATRYGMGLQQWEDKPDAIDDNTGIWHTLDFNECRRLGEVTYDTCSEYLKKAHELMEIMKIAVSYNNKSVVTWLLPSGFTAFQVKDKSKQAQVRVTIGNHKPQLVFYKFTDIPNKAQHKSSIAPDIVHSIDAWLLVTIINRLPNDANLAFVHDSFGSDSCYGNVIQEIAKESYFEVTSRTVMKGILSQVSDNNDIELPEPGKWSPEELFTANYIVC